MPTLLQIRSWLIAQGLNKRNRRSRDGTRYLDAWLQRVGVTGFFDSFCHDWSANRRGALLQEITREKEHVTWDA
jgi:hypothetical protein